jgi:hypothetical protein
MAHASAHGVWLKRALALGLGLPLVGFVFSAIAPPPIAKAARNNPPAGNVAEVVKLIDEKLEAGWQENKLTPSKPADDYEFIRRASLDIIGRIAKPAEIDEYLKDPKETRRALLIERLLKSEDYPKNWANIWSNWLLTRSGPFSRNNYHEALNVWLEDQFAGNTPYNKIVEALITAKGKNIGKDKEANAATNFILAHLGEPVPAADVAKEGHFTMIPVTARITRLFLGIQTQCTQCHDHPFDNKLHQRDFWGVNAFLRQVARKGTPPNMRQMNGPGLALELLDDPNINSDGLVTYEKRNGVFMVSKPVFLGGSAYDPDKDKDKDKKTRREELASMVLEHDNFPKAIVNRMWAHFFGKGLSNPVDDFTEQSQCAYPELLDELGKQYKHYSYNQKDLIRWICNSKAYQLSCVANKTNDKSDAEPLFSRMLLKSMSPEQLFESLWVAAKMEDALRKGAQGKDAKEKLKAEWQNSLIANFGDDEGNEVNFNGTVVQALMMMNGKDINDAINDANDGTVAQIMKKHKGTAKSVINELYLVSLNRPATDNEIAKIQKAFKDSKVRDSLAPQCQDLFWALLNSNEFLLNH